MTPAERAERLRLVVGDPVPLTGFGGWRFRIVAHGRELQLRNKALPHLRLDLLVSEAEDLLFSLRAALGEAHAMPVARVSWWRRGIDWLARHTWRKRHAVEHANAVAEMAKEFAQSRGGW